MYIPGLDICSTESLATGLVTFGNLLAHIKCQIIAQPPLPCWGEERDWERSSQLALTPSIYMSF